LWRTCEPLLPNNFLSGFPFEVTCARYMLFNETLRFLMISMENKKRDRFASVENSKADPPIEVYFTFPIGSSDIAYQRGYNSLLMLSRDNIVLRSHQRICIAVTKDTIVIRVCIVAVWCKTKYITMDEDLYMPSCS